MPYSRSLLPFMCSCLGLTGISVYTIIILLLKGKQRLNKPFFNFEVAPAYLGHLRGHFGRRGKWGIWMRWVCAKLNIRFGGC